MVACFIGHRAINDTPLLREKMYKIVTELVKRGVDTFSFGSRSEFDLLAWEIVTEIKETVGKLRRTSYNAPHEKSFTSKAERIEFEQFFTQVFNREVHYTDYEEAKIVEKAFAANKKAYIARNIQMIEDSDICVFYYNKDYLPPKRKVSKRDLVEYQPKSGTYLAYDYALSKGKEVINVFEML